MTVRDFLEMKSRREPITVLTCYDFLFARILEAEGVDMILVGDSLGQVVMGYDSTLPVTMDDMVHHTRAVRRGAPNTFTVVDLPFLSYQASSKEALHSAGRIMKETGAHAVKLEGGDEEACLTIRRLVRAGIPVMGHLGFVPQSIHMLGGTRVQGRDPEGANRLRDQATALEEAGCFSVVLELVSGAPAKEISQNLAIPTIGIGAGSRMRWSGPRPVRHAGTESGLHPPFPQALRGARRALWSGSVRVHRGGEREEVPRA